MYQKLAQIDQNLTWNRQHLEAKATKWIDQKWTAKNWPKFDQNLTKNWPKIAHSGQLECVQLLIDRGCNLRLKNINGKTAQDLALDRNHTEVAQWITNKMFGSISLQESQRPPNRPEESGSWNECAICFDERNGTFALQPCGHASLCEACCRRLVGSRCPMCRSNV